MSFPLNVKAGISNSRRGRDSALGYLPFLNHADWYVFERDFTTLSQKAAADTFQADLLRRGNGTLGIGVLGTSENYLTIPLASGATERTLFGPSPGGTVTTPPAAGNLDPTKKAIIRAVVDYDNIGCIVHCGFLSGSANPTFAAAASAANTGPLAFRKVGATHNINLLINRVGGYFTSVGRPLVLGQWNDVELFYNGKGKTFWWVNGAACPTITGLLTAASPMHPAFGGSGHAGGASELYYKYFLAAFER